MSEITHYPDWQVKYALDTDIALVHEYNIDPKANHIYLTSDERYISVGEGDEPGVEFAMAATFIRNLNLLMRRSTDPILIHMHTCGGVWEEGIAIYDLLRACPNRVTILSYTHARSMSSIIFQAADRRVMMPNSTFMFHGGTMVMAGTTKQFLTEAEQLKKSNEAMLRIYVEAMKGTGCYQHRSRKFIEGWLNERMDSKEEVYLNAKEAVKYGLADQVFGENGFDWPGLLTYR